MGAIAIGVNLTLVAVETATTQTLTCRRRFQKPRFFVSPRRWTWYHL